MKSCKYSKNSFWKDIYLLSCQACDEEINTKLMLE